MQTEEESSMSSPPKPSRTPIYIGILFVVAAAVFCRATNCPIGPWLHGTPESQTSNGEENMPLATEKSQVRHADQANFGSLVLKSDVPVLVDFYADWCSPCRRLAPVLEELARETPEARIVKVNVDTSPDLATEYGVDSIPSLKIFKNGIVTKELVGLAGKSQLKSLLAR
jgi:thioredoxin 1